MSSSRHSTVTFNGTPLENTASSLASIDTPVRAMAKVTIGDDLGVSDVPRQICQRSVETQQLPRRLRIAEEHPHGWQYVGAFITVVTVAATGGGVVLSCPLRAA